MVISATGHDNISNASPGEPVHLSSAAAAAAAADLEGNERSSLLTPSAEADDDGDGDGNGDLLTAHEARDLSRGLAERHLSMLGIAGAIGTGLFLGLGGAVQTAGPAGALIGYAVIGLVVCAVQFALGEAAALLPVTGSFVRHAEFLVDPALGVALGYNLVYGNMLSIPSEMTAICVLAQFWFPDSDTAVPVVVIVLSILLTVAVGMSRIRVLGEVEYVFAWLKVLLVVGLVIMGVVIAAGGVDGTPAVGFRYWRDPGPFVEYLVAGSTGRFLGVWEVLTGAVFSFAGVESIAVAAAETRNPQRAIPAACKQVFLRILLFYVSSIIVVGMLVASDDDRLDGQSGDAAQSPFVIAAQAAGVRAIPSIVNAVVITSAWSSSNQSLLAGSRVLYGLALKRQAPAVFLRTTSWGTPYACIALFTAPMFLSFLTLSSRAINVFWIFVDLTAAGVLVSWSSILLNHIRLRTAMRVQDIPLSRLPWHNRATLRTSQAALVMCLTVLLTSGFSVFFPGHWDTSTFISSYLYVSSLLPPLHPARPLAPSTPLADTPSDIPLVLGAYLIWKFLKKTSIVSLKSIPLVEALDQADKARERMSREI
ncbi:hypothetical protein GMORB2_7576 [Geosmithia morbida]|uniref:Amino acid permease/ SLC12A domain-containing protein n=1 Tax=Geosmithia morbida TaxID=1094350 RepID=A0A9P5CZU3_9HYPO|nr:uncharacterized protein GMORB2_7576 [Geosmithia morbida]KAF4121983.1 hypothetical protein GMORB2_7576 [Geosmithia morbida]